MPKSDYKVLDTWYAMGMVGTGSKDIEVKEVFVPERRALALARCRGGLEHPGAKLNAGPLFRVPIVASAGHPLSATALGTAEGAYEHVQECLQDPNRDLYRREGRRTSRRCRSSWRGRAA